MLFTYLRHVRRVVYHGLRLLLVVKGLSSCPLSHAIASACMWPSWIWSAALTSAMCASHMVYLSTKWNSGVSSVSKTILVHALKLLSLSSCHSCSIIISLLLLCGAVNRDIICSRQLVTSIKQHSDTPRLLACPLPAVSFWLSLCL